MTHRDAIYSLIAIGLAIFWFIWCLYADWRYWKDRELKKSNEMGVSEHE